MEDAMIQDLFKELHSLINGASHLERIDQDWIIYRLLDSEGFLTRVETPHIKQDESAFVLFRTYINTSELSWPIILKSIAITISILGEGPLEIVAGSIAVVELARDIWKNCHCLSEECLTIMLQLIHNESSSTLEELVVSSGCMTDQISKHLDLLLKLELLQRNSENRYILNRKKLGGILFNDKLSKIQ